MNSLRTFVCASFVVAAHLPALLHAQAVTPESSRSASDAVLELVIPSSMKDYSPGLTPRGPVETLWRRGSQESAQTGQPVPVVMPFDGTTPTLACPMPVARMAPEAIPHMPIAQVDSAVAAPRVVTLRGCTNPLDRRP